MKKTANNEIRELIRAIGLTQWEAGEILGINESSFSRMLRKELPPEKAQELVMKLKALGGRK